MNPQIPANQSWLALMIGNSRFHLAQFAGESLQGAWDFPQVSSEAIAKSISVSGFNPALSELLAAVGMPDLDLPDLDLPVPLLVASVVPDQTNFWKTYPKTHIIAPAQVPLPGVYPTLGIDRVLAVWGALNTQGLPVLVIDAGTALTFTGADVNGCLMGGAILPGVRVQMRSLTEKTAALPPVPLPQHLPERWATNTTGAIQSGVIHTVLAGIRDFVEAWWQQFPNSPVVLTGGDAAVLLDYLRSHSPQLANHLAVDPHLIFRGMCSYAAQCLF